MKKVFLGLLLMLLGVGVVYADGMRVMVWVGKSQDHNARYLHGDEMDTASRDLGDPEGSDWTFEKMTMEPERVASFFAGEIDRYDMIVTCPLTDDIPEEYTATLKGWIEKGGALCITDMMYPGNYQYVSRINPNLFLGADNCGKHVKPYRAETYTEPLDSFAFLPNRIEHQFVGWGHMWLPGNPGDWKVIKSCRCKEVEVLAWRYGKGYIYCSGKRDGRAILLENWRANLELRRAGMSVESLEGLDANALRAGSYDVKLKIRSEAAWSGKVVWELRPLESTIQRAVPQKPERFEALAKVTPGVSEVGLKFGITTRGKSWVTLKLVGTGTNPTVTLVSKAIELPQLVEVKGSRYRNIVGVSEYKRYPGVTRFPVKITPKDEKLSEMLLVVQVKDERGNIKGVPVKGMVPQKETFLLPVKTGDLKPGNYTVQYLLKVRGVAKDAGKCDFTVMSNEECPVYINEDFNTVIRGEEIFPLAIYHVGELEKMKELGFNTVHTWFGAGGNFKAQELGLYTICESFQRDWWREAISCTNLLFWYAFDEPRENSYYAGVAANNLYKEGDPKHRPTMMVTMDAEAFTRQGDYGDVIGRDPYFFPGAGDKIAAEIDKTWAAVEYDQPVWHVPQAQWMKDPRMYKNAAFQGVVHGARGIFWYCWDDGANEDSEYGGTGLKYETHLHEMVKETNADLKRLTPALLSPNRIQFQSPDKRIDGMLCADPKARKMYCILVNRFEEEATLKLSDVPELKTRGFGTQTRTLGPWEVAILEWPVR